MHHRFAILWIWLALGVSFAPGRTDAADDERAATAVRHEGKLIHLDKAGRFRVWGLEDGRFDGETSSKLARVEVTHLASDGDKLWAAGKSALYSWSSKEESWQKVADFNGGDEALRALAGVGGSPLLIFPSKVLAPVSGRTFRVPTLKGQLEISSLRLLSSLATDSMLWIGTGQGEWGGHLVGLNPKTGEWVQYYDALHYVTGITQAKPDEVIVSWSMSHFDADTLIRVHKMDGTPKTSYPELDSKYYQGVAYNPYDGTLYGVENTDIVSIKDGEPSKIAELEGPIFEREPMAIGVSPGVARLLPIAKKTLIVVPNDGMPWRLNAGKLTRLRGP
jgi:hypothetical protein